VCKPAKALNGYLGENDILVAISETKEIFLLFMARNAAMAWYGWPENQC